MRAAGVVKADPVTNDPTGMLLTLEAMTMYALLLQGSDHTLHHAVLLRTVGSDELLPQAIAPDQPRVVPAREDKAIV